MDLAAIVRTGPGRHQVDPDAVGPEVARQVARQRLERRLGHAHPVVGGPGHAGVEVEAHHRRSAGGDEQRPEGADEGLQRVGGDLQGDGDVVPPGAQDVAPQAVRGGEADGVEQTVEPSPPLAQIGRRRVELIGAGDVDLEHVDRTGKLAGHAPGERQAPAGAGQDDLGPFVLGQARHGEGERGVGQDAGDQDRACRRGVPRHRTLSAGARRTRRRGRFPGAVCKGCHRARRDPRRYRPSRSGSGVAAGRDRNIGDDRVAPGRARRVGGGRDP